MNPYQDYAFDKTFDRLAENYQGTRTISKINGNQYCVFFYVYEYYEPDNCVVLSVAGKSIKSVSNCTIKHYQNKNLFITS